MTPQGALRQLRKMEESGEVELTDEAVVVTGGVQCPVASLTGGLGALRK